MMYFKVLCLFYCIPIILGISIGSKINFQDVPSIAETDESESRSVELVLKDTKHRNRTKTRDYIPVILKRNDKKIEARIPIILEKETARLNKRKSSVTERPVPIVRGAIVPVRSDILDLSSPYIDGLDPPKSASQDQWRYGQNVDSNSQYPDSNGYYPNVGNGYTTSPRPVYGVPNQGRPMNGWGCQANPWNGNGYPPSSQYPSMNNYPPSSQYPSMNNYPPSSQYPSNNYPHQGQKPSHGDYPNNQGNYPNYPPTNQYPSYQGNNPDYYPNRGSSSNNGWSGNQWQQSNWQSNSWNGKQGGKWIPCDPYDLTSTDGHSRSSTRCPQSSRSSNPITFEPSATPASKVDGKTLHDSLPKDVEEIKP